MVVRIKPYQLFGSVDKVVAKFDGQMRIVVDVSKVGDDDTVILWGYQPTEFKCKTINPFNRQIAARNYINERMLVMPTKDSVGIDYENRMEAKVIFPASDDYAKAPYHYRYVPKSSEYRIHLFRTKLMGLQIPLMEKKVLQPHDASGTKVDKSLINWRHRSRNNGFLYEQVKEVPDAVRHAASNLFTNSRLDFAAVKVLYSKSTGNATVWDFETNPYLENEPLQKTYEAILREYL